MPRPAGWTGKLWAMKQGCDHASVNVFDQGSAPDFIWFTDADIAQVQVQNKLQLAMPLLPQEVQQQGIQVKKSSSSFLMVAGFAAIVVVLTAIACRNSMISARRK